ncbi:MAG: hypothetical protein LBC85_02955, partial [Fibromonadaceae bacterium]|nr:hypothetical protein [Fibromonadaceae bacterium]
MYNTTILQKIKISALLLAVALFFTSTAFANTAKNLNFFGQLGVHKTQSAQTLGHGVFGLGLFLEGAGIGSIIKDERFCFEKDGSCAYLPITNYIGGNAYPFLSLGLSDFFDISVSIPLHGDYLRIDHNNNNNVSDNLSAGGWGNVLASAKLRAPFDEYFPIDMALIFGFSIATGRTDLGTTQNYGAWVRDPAFLSTIHLNPISAAADEASPYTNSHHMMRFGGALTFDFSKMDAAPLKIHFNYIYRATLGEAVNDYLRTHGISAALQWTPVSALSLFGEFNYENPIGELVNQSITDLHAVSLGASFHLSSKVDLQIGAQIFTGAEDKYIEDLTLNLKADGGTRASYDARLIPKYMAFGGLTVRLFDEPEEEWFEEYVEPTVVFSVSPESVMPGQTVTLTWMTTDASEISIEGIGRVSAQGTRRVRPTESTTYTITAAGRGGVTTQSADVEVGDADGPTIVFSASPASIQSGQTVTLTWMTTNATEVSIEGIGSVPTQGTRRVRPTETTTYVITATGEGGTKTETVEVEIESADGPTIVFSASPETVRSGQNVTLTWMTTNATEVSIEGIGSVPPQGTRRVRPTESTTYIITATGEGGTKTELVEVEIEAADGPTIVFSVSPETILKGQTTTLTWMTTNATEVSIEGIGKVSAQGTRRVKPSETTTYVITATGEGGTKTESVEIEVEEPVIEAKVNLKGVNFLSGRAELTLDARRVLDGVAEQLLAAPNVKIEIHGHTDNVGNP